MRVLLALAILTVDLITPFIPVGSIFLAYVIIARPKWFRRWVMSWWEDQ